MRRHHNQFESYKIRLQQCFADISHLLVQYEGKYYLRSEYQQIEYDRELAYIIELVSANRIQDLNYGIVVDIKLEAVSNAMSIKIDILKADGRIYERQEYLVNSFSSARNFIHIFKKIPKKSLELLLRDYP